MANTTTAKTTGGAPHTDAKGKGQGATMQSASMMDEAKERAKDMASAVGDKAKDLAGSVADTARGVADRASDLASSAKECAQDAMSTVGEYLPDYDVRNMADDVGNVIRRYPIPCVLISMGIGFLLARNLRSWS